MDTLLKPARLRSKFAHSYERMEALAPKFVICNFIDECGEKAFDEHRIMCHNNVYEYIEDCKDNKSAIRVLEQLFVKTPNEIFARHLLATRRQKSGEKSGENRSINTQSLMRTPFVGSMT